MLFGDQPYRDFFQFTPPGTDLVYDAFFKVLTPHVWVTNAIVLALGVLSCWVCFSLSLEIMPLSWHLGLYTVLPRSADASMQSTIEPLHAYLQQRYVRVKVFSDQDEAWQRKYLKPPRA